MAPTICTDEELHLCKRVRDTRKRYENYAIRESNSTNSAFSIVNDNINKILNRRGHHNSTLRNFISINANANSNLREDYNIRMDGEISNDSINNDFYENHNTINVINSNINNNNRINLNFNEISIDLSTETQQRELISNYSNDINENSNQSYNSFILSDASSSTSCDRLTILSTTKPKNYQQNALLLGGGSLSLSPVSTLSSPATSERIENSASPFNNNNNSCDSFKTNNKIISKKRNHPYYNNLNNNNNNYYQQQSQLQKINNLRNKKLNKYEIERENDNIINNSIDICNGKLKLKSFMNPSYVTSTTASPILSSTSSSSSSPPPPITSSTPLLTCSDDDFAINETKIRSILQQRLSSHEKSGKCDKSFYRTKGLVEIAIKTIKLIRRNQMLQMKLQQLQMETKEFVQSVMSNQQNRAIYITKYSNNDHNNYRNQIITLNTIEYDNYHSKDNNNNNNNNDNTNNNNNNNDVKEYQNDRKQQIKQCIIDNNSNNRNISSNSKIFKSNVSKSENVVGSFKIH